MKVDILINKAGEGDILINKDGEETVFIQSNIFRKGKGSISPQLWFKYYHSSPSKRMALDNL